MKEEITIDKLKFAGIIICTSGSRDVLINGNLYRQQRGMLCVVSPIITICEIKRDENYSERCVIAEVELLYNIIKQNFDIILGLRIINKPILELTEPQIAWLLNRFDEIEERNRLVAETKIDTERKLLKHMSRLLFQDTMLSIIHLFFLNCEVKPVSVERNEAIAFRFIFSLHQHCFTKRNVDFYANNANLSVGHFSRLVKNATGKTPSEWIAYITMLNAKTLLKTSDKNIKEIAAELNFPEQYTFRKYFKHHTGMSPKEYRKIIKNNK